VSRLYTLTRKDAVDSPYKVTELNIEIATAYGFRMAKNWTRRIPEWADPVKLEEAAVDAVMKAASRYDPAHSRGATFFTYAHSMVEGALREEDRKMRRRPADISLESVAFASRRKMQEGEFNSDPVRIADILVAEGSDPAGFVGDSAFLDDLFERICPLALGTGAKGVRMTRILHLRYVEGIKQNEIAPIYGVTPGRIHQIEDEAKQLIRDFLAKELA
jgi:RNA polymerase sigma factor (sigma-70 family)